jgi:hypothetical protein
LQVVAHGQEEALPGDTGSIEFADDTFASLVVELLVLADRYELQLLCKELSRTLEVKWVPTGGIGAEGVVTLLLALGLLAPCASYRSLRTICRQHVATHLDDTVRVRFRLTFTPMREATQMLALDAGPPPPSFTTFHTPQSGNIQGTFREHPGPIQGENIHGAFRTHSGNV